MGDEVEDHMDEVDMEEEAGAPWDDLLNEDVAPMDPNDVAISCFLSQRLTRCCSLCSPACKLRSKMCSSRTIRNLH